MKLNGSWFQLPEVQSRSNNNSTSSSTPGTPLNILEVADPQLAVVVHLMTPLIPLNQPLESPTSHPERVQRALAMELIERAKLERQASHGLLLASMENSCKFLSFSIKYIRGWISTFRGKPVSCYSRFQTPSCRFKCRRFEDRMLSLSLKGWCSYDSHISVRIMKY